MSTVARARLDVESVVIISAAVRLSSRQLGVCIDAMIEELDRRSGDADFEVDVDHGVDDVGEEEMAA